MAYRKPSGRKLPFSKVLPIWGVSHTNVVNMAFETLMHKLGIGDMRSYFFKLRVWIVIAVFVCAISGAYNYGIKGFIFGGVLGLAAPAALIWVGVLVIGIFFYMAIFCAAWLAIWYVLMWLLHS